MGWKSVETKPPESEDIFLARDNRFVGGGIQYGIGTYVDGVWINDVGSGFRPTHWMLIPRINFVSLELKGSRETEGKGI